MEEQSYLELFIIPYELGPILKELILLKPKEKSLTIYNCFF